MLVRNSQQGFTLFEILIALIIIAIGVLGHAKMQVKSMDIAQRTVFAQTANTALLDLAQRMRANPEAALAGEFDDNNRNSHSGLNSKDCSTAACSRSEFAQYEVKDWYDDLDIQLPMPRFSIITKDNLVSITLIWDATRRGWASGSCDRNSATHQCAELTVWLG